MNMYYSTEYNYHTVTVQLYTEFKYNLLQKLNFQMAQVTTQSIGNFLSQSAADLREHLPSEWYIVKSA